MKASLKNSKELALIAGLLAAGTIHVGATGDNPPKPIPPGKLDETGAATSDEAESAAQEQDIAGGGNGGDCSGCDSYCDEDSESYDPETCACPPPTEPTTTPSEPGSIKEVMSLALVPNEQDLDDGALVLYLDEPSSNLGDRQFLEFYAMPYMRVTSQQVGSTHAEYTIAQASGVRLGYKAAVEQPSAGQWIKGAPTGSAAYAQTHVTYADASGNPTNYANADVLRQHRAAGGYVEYSKNGGRVLRAVTRKGRIHDLQNLPVEVIRENQHGNYFVESNSRTGIVRQVKTVAGLLDVVPLSGRSYEIRKYAPSQIGAKDPSGLYAVLGNPYRTMKVEAPSDDASKLIITKTSGSLSTVTTHTVETPDLQSQLWKQDVVSGQFAYSRNLERFPKVGQPGYRGFERTYRMKNSPGVVYPAVEDHYYKLGGTSYNYRPVASSEKFPYKIAVPRTREYEEPTYSTNPVGGRPKKVVTRKALPINLGYKGDGSKANPRMDYKTMPYYGSGGNYVDRKRSYDYTRHHALDVADEFDYRPRTRTETLNGQVVSKTYTAFYTDATTGEYVERMEKVGDFNNDSWGAATNQVKEKRYYGPGADQGRVKQVLHLDGTVTTYSYQFNTDTSLETTETTNLTSAGLAVEGKTTRSVILRNPRGHVTQTTNYAYTGGSYVAYEKIGQQHNNQGKLVYRDREDLLSSQTRVLLDQQWDGDKLVQKTDAQGIVTYYDYNDAGMLIEKRRAAVPASGSYPAQPEIVTTHTGTFQITSKGTPSWKEKTTTITAGALVQTILEKYDSENQLIYSQDADGYITEYSYNLENTVKTETAPDLTTTVRTYSKDDKLISVTGTGTVAKYYHYAPRTGGGIVTTTYLGVDNGPRYVRKETDALGRTVKTEQPGYNNTVLASVYSYGNVYHGPTKVATTSSPTMVYGYDELGNRVLSGQTADNDSLSEDSNTDIMRESDTVYELASGKLWMVSSQYTWPEAGSSTKKLLGASKSLVAGFTGLEYSVSQSVDINSNVTTSTTTLDRANLLSVTSVQAAHKTGVDTSTSYAGRLMSVSQAGVQNPVTYGYDALGRTVSVKNPRHTDSSAVVYVAGGNNVYSQANAKGETTTYSYYGQGELGAGNVKETTLPDNSKTYSVYNEHGLTVAVWGSQTYTRWYEYNQYDQMTGLHTWQSDPALDVANFPASVPSGSTLTSWIYDGATGLLTGKRYDNGSAQGQGPDYTYDVVGRLATRTWARNITTTYIYDDFGRLDLVSYSDGVTKGVDYSYDRLGRVDTVVQGPSNGIQHTHGYTYKPGDLGLDTVTVDYGSNQSGGSILKRTLTYSRDAYTRATGFSLETTSSVEETAAAYTYEAVTGRLATVSNPSQANSTFTYGYNANGFALVDTVTGPVHTVTNTYEPNRNILDVKTNQVTGVQTPVSAFDYSVNELGQRDQVATSGSAFGNSFTRDFGYDAKGQVVSDNHDTNNTFDRTYAFDGIGNRTSATEDTTTVNYTANSLNQYTAVGTNSLTHDADGNLTNDGTKKYVYDAENRLVQVIDQSDVEIASYEYDAYSRRITKTANSTTTRFVYDGWNPVAVYTGTTLAKAYTWGQDLSGSMQGAGGVGGLLAVKENSSGNSHYPTYDGNGNVSEYLDSTGTVSAHYEYDAFGKTVVSNGTKAGDFAHRFSTKQWDGEASLYYYVYRFYSADTARWSSRDPMEESWDTDELNLYSFVGNDGINFVDLLGLQGFRGGFGPARHMPFDPNTAGGGGGGSRGGGGAARGGGRVPTHKHSDGRHYNKPQTPNPKPPAPKPTPPSAKPTPPSAKPQIPQKAHDTLSHVEKNNGSPPQGYKGGREFKNHEGKLPKNGKYKEYDVDPMPCKGQKRNAERIVVDTNTGKAWYTDDHYSTFTPIN